MAARTLQVCFATQAGSFVRGFGAREMLTDLRGGRPPTWWSRGRAWATQPSTAHDLIALAETRGYVVELVSEEHLLRLAGVEIDEIKAEHAASKGALFL